MSQDTGADITLTSAWVDLTVAYPALANAQIWVQCRAVNPAAIAFTSDSAAPTGGGFLINRGESFGGKAAHVWARATGGGTTITAGVI